MATEQRAMSKQTCELAFRLYNYLNKEQKLQKKDKSTIDTLLQAAEITKIENKLLLNTVIDKKLEKHSKLIETKEPLSLTESEYEALRRIILEIHINAKTIPDIDTIIKKVQDDTNNYLMTKSKLKNILNQMGYIIYGNKYVIENYASRKQKINYLKQIKQAMAEGKNLIYVILKVFHCPSSNESYSLAVAHASGTRIFFADSFRVFQYSGVKRNNVQFLLWLKAQVMTKLQSNSVIVLDQNTLNLITRDAPNCYSSKSAMLKWLSKHEIFTEPNLRKPEIYEIIKQHRSCYVSFEFGMPVINLPKHYNTLNPLSIGWSKLTGEVNEMIAKRPMKFMTFDMKKLFTANLWKSSFKEMETYQNLLIKEEAILTELDNTIASIPDHIQILLGLTNDDEDSNSAVPGRSQMSVDAPSDDSN